MACSSEPTSSALFKSTKQQMMKDIPEEHLVHKGVTLGWNRGLPQFKIPSEFSEEGVLTLTKQGSLDYQVTEMHHTPPSSQSSPTGHVAFVDGPEAPPTIQLPPQLEPGLGGSTLGASALSTSSRGFHQPSEGNQFQGMSHPNHSGSMPGLAQSSSQVFGPLSSEEHSFTIDLSPAANHDCLCRYPYICPGHSDQPTTTGVGGQPYTATFPPTTPDFTSGSGLHAIPRHMQRGPIDQVHPLDSNELISDVQMTDDLSDYSPLRH